MEDRADACSGENVGLLEGVVCVEDEHEPPEPAASGTASSPLQQLCSRIGQQAAAPFRWFSRDRKRWIPLVPASLPVIVVVSAAVLFCIALSKERAEMGKCYRRYELCMHRVAVASFVPRTDLQDTMIKWNDLIHKAHGGRSIYQVYPPDGRCLYSAHKTDQLWEPAWYCPCAGELRSCPDRSVLRAVHKLRKAGLIVMIVAASLVIPCLALARVAVPVLEAFERALGSKHVLRQGEGARLSPRAFDHSDTSAEDGDTSTWALKVSGLTILEVSHHHRRRSSRGTQQPSVEAECAAVRPGPLSPSQALPESHNHQEDQAPLPLGAAAAPPAPAGSEKEPKEPLVGPSQVRAEGVRAGAHEDRGQTAQERELQATHAAITAGSGQGGSAPAEHIVQDTSQ